MNDCIFCKIISNEIGSKRIYEDDYIIATLDINPRYDGHTLIIPKKHFDDYSKLDSNTWNHIMEKVPNIAKILCDKLDCNGYSLTINYGDLLEVNHFHMHILPHTGDEVHSVDEIYDKLTK